LTEKREREASPRTLYTKIQTREGIEEIEEIELAGGADDAQDGAAPATVATLGIVAAMRVYHIVYS
jgi:hypothetical protein